MESFISLVKEKALIFKQLLDSNDYFRVYSNLDADSVSGAIILINLFKFFGKNFHLTFVSENNFSSVAVPTVFIGFNKDELNDVNAFFFSSNGVSVCVFAYFLFKEFVNSNFCASIAFIGSKAGLIELNESINSLLAKDSSFISGEVLFKGKNLDEWVSVVNQFVSDKNPSSLVSSFF